jgi:hypothetical protein
MPREDGYFKQGASPNPNGRPKGSRNKLSQKFLSDVEKHWKKHGRGLLDNILQTNPTMYLKIIAGLISKDVDDNSQDRTTVEDGKQRFLRELQQLVQGNDDEEPQNT